MTKYLIAFLVSMVPLIELRAGLPLAISLGIDEPVAIAVCAVGNMLPAIVLPILWFAVAGLF